MAAGTQLRERPAVAESCGTVQGSGGEGRTAWDQVYLLLAWHLDRASLCAVDAACRHSLAVNAVDRGPWAELGKARFAGLELRYDGVFDSCQRSGGGADHGLPEVQRPARWKRRYIGFCYALRTFEAPFGTPRIVCVGRDNDNAYLQCLLRPDVLAADPQRSVYVEIEVLANPDKFSISLADFDEGGCGSFTFSPDTGVVICEHKVSDSPRRVKGRYKQPLRPSSSEERFRGAVGFLLRAGRLAFFRRRLDATWETTGFVSDLTWVQGPQLTPCVAFRAAGLYDVRIATVGSEPPVAPTPPCDEVSSEWLPLDWDETLELSGERGRDRPAVATEPADPAADAAGLGGAAVAAIA